MTTLINFINARQVCVRTGLGRSTLYRLISEGTFPPPVKITETASRWPEEAVVKWQRERMVDTGYAGYLEEETEGAAA